MSRAQDEQRLRFDKPAENRTAEAGARIEAYCFYGKEFRERVLRDGRETFSSRSRDASSGAFRAGGGFSSFSRGGGGEGARIAS